MPVSNLSSTPQPGRGNSEGHQSLLVTGGDLQNENFPAEGSYPLGFFNPHGVLLGGYNFVDAPV